MHLAAWGGCAAAVQWLVQRGCDPHEQSRAGRTSLELAVQHGRHEVEYWLVKNCSGVVRRKTLRVQQVIVGCRASHSQEAQIGAERGGVLRTGPLPHPCSVYTYSNTKQFRLFDRSIEGKKAPAENAEHRPLSQERQAASGIHIRPSPQGRSYARNASTHRAPQGSLTTSQPRPAFQRRAPSYYKPSMPATRGSKT
ncbi:hypothetical protein O3P69_011718 [Scylla paramamosain]|uniref:Uncharacterized protein n=1 Tax=Scylla paramamosain TaxID=85552 RepID=A0AAW0SI59_SCYPA